MNISRSGFYEYLKLMRNMKLLPKDTRYRYKRYNQNSSSIERPNLLNQTFKTDGRNKIWVGDIAYVPTKKVVLHLAVFLDIYSRKVSGWSMSTKMKDTLVMNAFMQAYDLEQPKKGPIVHTDQGSQLPAVTFKHYCVYMELYQVQAEKKIRMTMP